MGVKPQVNVGGLSSRMSFSEESSSSRHVSKNDEISLVEVLSLAETSIGSLKQIIETFDSKIYSEFRAIAEQISSTKAEIAQISTQDVSKGHIPDAGQELAAVVETTEEATHKIMEAAETIMTADPSDISNYYTTVNENIMTIFEACSFQDISGQRIARVVETLDFIDKRISFFAEKIGAGSIDAPKADDENYYFDEDERQRAERKKDQMIYGPQDTQDAISQNEIDNLLNK
ncbi:MAG: chemotaxis protein [Pseudomonadota bacterium]